MTSKDSKSTSPQHEQRSQESNDDPVPSYDTVVAESVAASSRNQQQQHSPIHPSFHTTSPTHIFIVPPTASVSLRQPIISRGPPAGRRFCSALFNAFLCYLLFCIISGLVTDAAIREGHHRNHKRRQDWILN